jgi:hypothetical protein
MRCSPSQQGKSLPKCNCNCGEMLAVHVCQPSINRALFFVHGVHTSQGSNVHGVAHVVPDHVWRETTALRHHMKCIPVRDNSKRVGLQVNKPIPVSPLFPYRIQEAKRTKRKATQVRNRVRAKIKPKMSALDNVWDRLNSPPKKTATNCDAVPEHAMVVITPGCCSVVVVVKSSTFGGQSCCGSWWTR